MLLPGFGMDDDLLEQGKTFAQRALYPLGLEVHLAYIGRAEEVASQNTCSVGLGQVTSVRTRGLINCTLTVEINDGRLYVVA
jgi:hypothetical protein